LSIQDPTVSEIRMSTLPEPETNITEIVDQVVGLLKRRRWWIISIACFMALATVGLSLRLPDRYSSEAILSVVQQQVSQRYVETGATSSPAVLIQGMARNILSRGRLVAVADELGLYARERRQLTPEGLAERMQKDVDIEPLDDAGRNDFRAFKITFTAETPTLAQSAANRLSSLFIEENLKTRGEQAGKTASFVTAELENAKNKLSEQEKRLQDFKMRNLTELPEQQQANFAVLTDRRMQLQNVMAGLSRVQQERTSLESLVSGKVAILQSERSNLLTRFTPRHSEVIKKNQEIAQFQAVLDHMKAGKAGIANPGSGTLTPDPSLAQWESQANSIAFEGENLSRDKQRLDAEIGTYQNRVNIAPLAEQQLAGLVRDYELYKKEYEDLLGKQLQSQQTVSLEERQEGQQFRLVDPPTLPAFPSSPKRLKISLGGLGAGLALGLVLAFLIDMKEKSFHFDREISRSFNLPLVVAIPLLLTPAEERSRTWTRVVESVAAGVMVMAVCAAELYVFRHG